MEEDLTSLLFKARACREQGLLDESKEYYEQCLVSSWSEGDMTAMAAAVNGLGNLHVLEGRYGQAKQYFDKAIALARRTKDTGLVGSVLKDFGNLNALLGRYERRVGGSGARISSVERDKQWRREASLYHELAGKFRIKNKLDEAIAFYSRCARMSRRACDWYLLFKSTLALSTVLTKKDRCFQARKFNRRALVVAKKYGTSENLAEALHVYAMIERIRGEWTRSEKALKKAESYCNALYSSITLAEVHMERGLLAEATGKWRTAIVSMSRAQRMMEELSGKRSDDFLDQKLGEVESNLFRIARTIGQIVEMRAMMTPGHSERVARLSLELAREVGLASFQGKGVFVAGFLHDLGKVRVRRDVLTGKGKLTEEKLELLRKHPVWSCDLLDEAEFTWPVRESILSHHERYDGTGYPRGLQGDEIPIEARILAIADVYDILTAPRHEWRASTGSEVLAIMEEDMRGKFDPDLFKTFKEMITEKLIVLEGTEFHAKSYLGVWGASDEKKAG